MEACDYFCIWLCGNIFNFEAYQISTIPSPFSFTENIEGKARTEKEILCCHQFRHSPGKYYEKQ